MTCEHCDATKTEERLRILEDRLTDIDELLAAMFQDKSEADPCLAAFLRNRAGLNGGR